MLTATLGRFCDLGIRGLSTLRIGFVRTLKSASSPYRGTNEKGGYRRAGIRIPDGGYPAADFRDVTANFVILHIRVVTEIHHPDCGFPPEPTISVCDSVLFIMDEQKESVKRDIFIYCISILTVCISS